MKPLCFDTDEQFREWYYLANMTKIERNNYCNDCTPEFQMRMINKCRCEHPETFFYMRKNHMDGESVDEMIGYSYVTARGLVKVETPEEAVAAHMKKKLRVTMSNDLVTV